MNNLNIKSNNSLQNKRYRDEQPMRKHLRSKTKKKRNGDKIISLGSGSGSGGNNISNINMNTSNIPNNSKLKIKKNRNKKGIERIELNSKNTKFVKKLKILLLKNGEREIDKEIISSTDNEFFEFLVDNIDINDDKDKKIGVTMRRHKISKEADISLPGAGVETLRKCIICLDEIDFENKHFLRCGHVFHKDCIKKWEDQPDIGQKCPVCKQKIDSGEVNSESEENEEEEEELEDISENSSIISDSDASFQAEFNHLQNRRNYQNIILRNICFETCAKYWMIVLVNLIILKIVLCFKL
jgi:hypothetical protein